MDKQRIGRLVQKLKLQLKETAKISKNLQEARKTLKEIEKELMEQL